MGNKREKLGLSFVTRRLPLEPPGNGERCCEYNYSLDDPAVLLGQKLATTDNKSSPFSKDDQLTDRYTNFKLRDVKSWNS